MKIPAVHFFSFADRICRMKTDASHRMTTIMPRLPKVLFNRRHGSESLLRSLPYLIKPGSNRVSTGVFAVFVILCFSCGQSSSRCFGQETPQNITIGTWNLEWFYDDDKADNRSKLSKEKAAPSKAEWNWKLNSVAEVVGRTKPYIMAFQEVENRKVMFDLKNLLRSKYKLSYRIAFVEGFDTFTEQDVAILFRDGCVEMSRREQNAAQWKSKQFKNLSKHLFTKFEWGTGPQKEKLTLLNVHLRAMADREQLRIQQIKLIREWINEEIKSGGNVIVVGDLNTEHLHGKQTAKTDIGILRGLNDNDPTNDLFDANEFIPEAKRSSHFTGKQFDRILFSAALKQDTPNRKDLVFTTANVASDIVIRGKRDNANLRWNNLYAIPQAERDISDHYPVIARFDFR